MTLQETIQSFLLHLKTLERSGITIKNYRSDLLAFSKWLWAFDAGKNNLVAITASLLRDYKESLTQQHLKPKSINRKLAALKSWLRWAEQEGHIPHMPAVPKTLPEHKAGPRWLSNSEQKQLLKVVEKTEQTRDKAIVDLLLNTGLRVQELCSLRWNAVSINGRSGSLVVARGKGNKRREVPLNQTARQAFSKLGLNQKTDPKNTILKGQRGPLSPRGVQFMLNKYADKARLPNLSPHLLRHTFCKNLVDAGVGIEKVAMIAGHECLETTKRYCEPSLQDLQQAVERIGKRG